MKHRMDKWDRWICLICEYVYNPCVGDPTHGIESGTSFKDLPKNWVCPGCGSDKDQFEICVEEEVEY